jgi:hypothetical protein
LSFTYQQDDQIGRIFAYWAIVYFGEFLKMTEVKHNVADFFSAEKDRY